MMSDTPRPEREPALMATCPCCDGYGQVGRRNSPCEACWMRGVVPGWKAIHLTNDRAWWFKHQGTPRRTDRHDGTGMATNVGTGPGVDYGYDYGYGANPSALDICLACNPAEPCPNCPLVALSLAA